MFESIQADVIGHSIAGRASDQVVQARATNTILYLTGGRALAGVGESHFVFSNNCDIEEFQEIDDQPQAEDDDYADDSEDDPADIAVEAAEDGSAAV